MLSLYVHFFVGDILLSVVELVELLLDLAAYLVGLLEDQLGVVSFPRRFQLLELF